MKNGAEGDPESPIWIIGINPAAASDWTDPDRTREMLKDWLLAKEYKGNPNKERPYFKDFSKVSGPLFDKLGERNGIAHTDIVKCASKRFPPEQAKGAKANVVVQNCRDYLLEQIRKHKPRMLICNGSPVSKYILEFIPPSPRGVRNTTSYKNCSLGYEVCVILSGFIGRIDDYAKRRLGVEIEQRAMEMDIVLTE